MSGESYLIGKFWGVWCELHTLFVWGEMVLS